MHAEDIATVVRKNHSSLVSRLGYLCEWSCISDSVCAQNTYKTRETKLTLEGAGLGADTEGTLPATVGRAADPHAPPAAPGPSVGAVMQASRSTMQRLADDGSYHAGRMSYLSPLVLACHWAHQRRSAMGSGQDSTGCITAAGLVSSYREGGIARALMYAFTRVQGDRQWCSVQRQGEVPRWLRSRAGRVSESFWQALQMEML